MKILQRILPPTIVLALAVLGSFQIKPFGIEYSDGQLISAMLALLAIDAFVERVDSFRSLENKVSQIHHRLVVQNKSGIAFVRRIEQERLPDLFRSAQKSIWIAGPSLDSIVQCQDVLREQLAIGREIRILMVDPTPELIEWYGKHVVGPTYSLDDAVGRARAKERIEDNRDRLKRLSGTGIGTFSMRVLERIMWFGFVILDADTKKQRMDVQVYMYKKSADIAPILRFDARSDNDWYETFMDQYQVYWGAARDVL